MRIYTLRLQQGKYYVGKTEDVTTRYRQHCEGTGSEWTRCYPPVEIVEDFEGDGFDEEKYVLKYMNQYGIDNVRGGSYCVVDLPDPVCNEIARIIASATDKCFGCGQSGHFGNQCPNCRRCGRDNHIELNCYANRYNDGRIISQLWKC